MAIKTVVFPYFYGIHQLFHSITTAMELSILGDEFHVQLLSCNSEHTECLLQVKEQYKESNAEIIEIRQPFRFKYLNFKNKSYPSVNAMVSRARSYLKNADAVVTTSHGSAKMFSKFKITKPKLIIMKHGCGDRAYSFDPAYGKYDLVLIGGEHHRRIMLEKNITSENKIKIIGYPKFDIPIKSKDIKNKIFKNDNPVVLYNPHWQPEYSSYNTYSKFILEYFKANVGYNLIFAPHILLKHWKTHYHYNLNLDDYKSDSIYIDFGSRYSADNSYIKIADLYIGDVSSLIYEFIALEPRPCIFLNAHSVNWKNNLYYRFWELGRVVEYKKDFDEIFKLSINDNSFELLQKERIKEYMDIADIPASKRAAIAIKEFLNE